MTAWIKDFFVEKLLKISLEALSEREGAGTMIN